MEKVIILTKDNCPKCIALKMYLEKGLRDKYANNIEYIKLEENKDSFYEYVEKFNLMATPVMIKGEAVLENTSPGLVSDFLVKNIG